MANVLTNLGDLLGRLQQDNDEVFEYEVVVQERTTRAPITYEIEDIVIKVDERLVVIQIELRDD